MSSTPENFQRQVGSTTHTAHAERLAQPDTSWDSTMSWAPFDDHWMTTERGIMTRWRPTLWTISRLKWHHCLRRRNKVVFQ
jgi:hypothetical protein